MYGQYRVIERIAVGGMAEIYLGVVQGVEGFERPVVIKKVRRRFSQDDRFHSMLIKEAKITASLGHHNIVQILDLGRNDQDEYFIVMEFVDGRDLRSVMDRAEEQRIRLERNLVVYVALEVLAALDYAHRKTDDQGRPLHLIHRDVSPANILISNAGEVKLTDFGIARYGRDISAVGSLKGKLAYMSPEQARSEPVDLRSDLFSLGAVLFEILLRRRVFTAETDVDLLEEVRRAGISMPSSIDPEIPVELERILLKALAPDPRRRFSSADEMSTALRRFQFQHAGPRVGPHQLSAMLRYLFTQKGVPQPQRSAVNFTITTAEEFSRVSFRGSSFIESVTADGMPSPQLLQQMHKDLAGAEEDDEDFLDEESTDRDGRILGKFVSGELLATTPGRPDFSGVMQAVTMIQPMSQIEALKDRTREQVAPPDMTDEVPVHEESEPTVEAAPTGELVDATRQVHKESDPTMEAAPAVDLVDATRKAPKQKPRVEAAPGILEKRKAALEAALAGQGAPGAEERRTAPYDRFGSDLPAARDQEDLEESATNLVISSADIEPAPPPSVEVEVDIDDDDDHEVSLDDLQTQERAPVVVPDEEQATQALAVASPRADAVGEERATQERATQDLAASEQVEADEDLPTQDLAASPQTDEAIPLPTDTRQSTVVVADRPADPKVVKREPKRAKPRGKGRWLSWLLVAIIGLGIGGALAFWLLTPGRDINALMARVFGSSKSKTDKPAQPATSRAPATPRAPSASPIKKKTAKAVPDTGSRAGSVDAMQVASLPPKKAAHDKKPPDQQPSVTDPKSKKAAQPPPKQSPKPTPERKSPPKQLKPRPTPKKLQPKPTPPVEKKQARTVRSSAKKKGQVVIKSDPWAYIHIDGRRSKRTTSARPFTLSAGKHRIELVNPALDLRKTLEIEVEAGGIVRRFVRLK